MVGKYETSQTNISQVFVANICSELNIKFHIFNLKNLSLSYPSAIIAPNLFLFLPVLPIVSI